jgi:PAS domain S-box-containing protein
MRGATVPRGNRMSQMAAVNLIGSHDYALVALSVLIAMFASYAALDLAGRVTAAGGWTRAAWLLGGAGAMGTGIWSMHYIGMLAFILPIPVAYHWPTVLLSLFTAILASVIALYVVSRQKMGASRAVAGSVLMGAGIASMHYIGMAAMRLPAICQFNSFLVVLSVVFAVLISLAALWITFHFRDEKTGIGWEKLAGAVVMGAAIPVMHYTGMAAASFTLAGMPADLSHAVSISTLGTAGIAAVTFIVLGLAILTSWVDRRLAAQTLELQEETLRRSEGYLAEAQRLTGIGSWAWNVATRRSVYWSQENYRLFGFDPEGAIPSDEAFYQRIHPEDRDRVRREVFLERPDQGSHFDVDFRIVLPDGAMKYVRSTGHPVFNISGDLVEYVGTSIDVTERKRVDEERERLLASERAAFAEAVAAQQRFRDLVNSVEAIVWEANVPSFQFSFISKEAERVLGYPVERWLSEPTFWKDHVHPEDREWALQYCQTATAEKRNHQFEHRMIAADGSVVWLRDLVTVVVEGDRVTRVRGLMVDLTNRKKAEEALRQARADLAYVSRVTTMGELTASLAHEVNQPIAAAVTNANTCLRWLTRDHPDVEEARAAATRIVKDGTRAGEIISRTRLLFEKGTPQHDLVDVNEVIGEMIVLLRGETTRYSISVRTELAADLPQVMGDRVQLQQVMMNLIMNSIDAMKDADGTRELAIKSQRTENDQVLVSVSDTGVGLPPQQADQVFSAFFTTKPHGTGMGLRISRSIIESHGGRLWAADNLPRGASFRFTLPTKVEVPE